ncbi:hypothetical protein LIER_19063 [Lithospermum erythrorhizon]|uniref:Reverse transcriptase n=1 Tax=Lithospermum erythrorhizon TaxID=34254 RepID=A0AAV3QIL3_LITER
MIIKSRKVEDHEANLRESFENPRRYKLRLNPDKCFLGVTSGMFLGYMISQRGIEPNLDKIDAVQAMESPKTQKEAHRLTGRIAALTLFLSRVGDRGLLSSKPSTKGNSLSGPLIVNNRSKSLRRTSNHSSCWLGWWLGTSYNFIWQFWSRPSAMS